MALIDCYECGKQISDIAPACPSCGAPAAKPDAKIDSSFRVHTTKPPRVVSFGLFLGVVFAPFLFFWFLLRDGYSNKVKALGVCWLVIFVYGYLNTGTGVKEFQAVDTKASKPVSKLQQLEEKYPDSSATYNDVNSEVGCASKYSDQKKEDIFESEFKNRWMVWTGVVVLADADDISLNVDGIGTQDLQVDFLDKGAGYNIKKGQKVKVRFLMTSAGGCFLPFSGDYAVIDGQREYGKLGDIFKKVERQEEAAENKEESIDPLTYAFKGDAAKAQTVTSQNIIWTVQVASLSNLSIAERLKQKLHDLGYESYIVTKEGINRVFVGPIQDRAEAERVREQLVRQNQLKGFVARYKDSESPNQ
ncbi:SPOR domain-containing protein [Pseudomonas mohnii]|uniref:SPOR domain-containing protein n=1 Tax=Pseudomonas mohnii TaxID=395600 RepID=UPI0018C4B6B2|nr:SPOR domain-containing protein [Pseudomonas mohnii]MBH8613017.1 SPOR domain-containing protein [Pseudomonas mohnii]